MIANSAFLAAMVLMLIVFVLMGELEFLTPYKRTSLSASSQSRVDTFSGIFTLLLLETARHMGCRGELRRKPRLSVQEP